MAGTRHVAALTFDDGQKRRVLTDFSTLSIRLSHDVINYKPNPKGKTISSTCSVFDHPNMNTDLIVSFSNLHSAFVNLPPAWANALWEKLKVLKPGDVVLQLSWKSPTDVYKAYVGWAGAATAKVSDVPTERAPIQYLEIDAQYGRALGLRDGQKVRRKLMLNGLSWAESRYFRYR